MLYRVPVVGLMLGALAVLMLVPMCLGVISADWKVARSFLYTSLFTLTVAIAVGLVTQRASPAAARGELLRLLLAWLVLPVFAALPVAMVTPAVGYDGAWFEMVASLTTTGGSVYGDLDSVPAAIHLWRGVVGWFGGLITLIAAYAILAPRRLGGFEIESAASRNAVVNDMQFVALGASTPPLSERIGRAMRVVFPIYFGLTAGLAIAFHILGQGGLHSSVHAMAILSTSGISPSPQGLASADSLIAELLAAVVMALAALRLLFGRASQAGVARSWRSDNELNLMLGLVVLATLLLFGRHWAGALTVEVETSISGVFAAIWGNVFTTLSFLTTVGFVSSDWAQARDWSGLENPGLILLGLCTIGGGAATTAGGIKLIRAYALLRHGLRELDRIAQPISIIGVGSSMRGMMRRGAVIAWTFVMLYFITLLASITALTAAGLKFEDALIAATASLSNTGPIYELLTQDDLGFSGLDQVARLVLGLTMIIGRFEVLALVSLFNADIWKKKDIATLKHW